METYWFLVFQSAYENITTYIAKHFSGQCASIFSANYTNNVITQRVFYIYAMMIDKGFECLDKGHTGHLANCDLSSAL